MLQHFTHKLIIASASLLAALSIIFAGYSAWTFTTERREDIATGVSVCQVYSDGNFDGTTDFPKMVVFEQNGVRFFRKNGDMVTFEQDIKFWYKVTANNKDQNFVFGIRVRINPSIITGNSDGTNEISFQNYFQIKDIGEDKKLKASEVQDLPESSNGEYWIDLEKWAIATTDSNGVYHDFNLNITDLNNLIEYKSGMNPTNQDQYNKLNDLIKMADSSFLIIELWQGIKA